MFFHLKHELPLTNDGHRPMNTDFRDLVDRRLLEILNEIKVPYLVVSGSVEQRVTQICEHMNLMPVMSISEAIERARLDYTGQDLRLEDERSKIRV
ncbi:hypothetical protein [Serratia fonticola]|uniref:hypothetical protein n=1 Tax=Serratia fonticola TaxID=47917 RepID=UPI00358DB48E